MFEIKDGIQFEKNKSLPKKMLEHIKKYGMRLPFNGKNFTYKNTELDDYVKIKGEDGKIYKFDRKLNKSVLVT